MGQSACGPGQTVAAAGVRVRPGVLMRKFRGHFQRAGLGAWTGTAPTEIALPTGRIQIAPTTRFMRGTTFMGLDIANMLDEEYARPRERA